MAIKGLIFDFDGLILDTEIPEYRAWQETYREYGSTLPLNEWSKLIGASMKAFDPFLFLELQIGRKIDRDRVWKGVRARATELLDKQQILPGVVDILKNAKQEGLKLAVASSSPREWVFGHLEQRNLLHYFDTVCTGDMVPAVKPDPALYRCALEKLGLAPQEAIAFEDSPNGITAARAAGIFCVAVPNEITLTLDTSHADLVLKSLATMPLRTMMDAVGKRAVL